MQVDSEVYADSPDDLIRLSGLRVSAVVGVLPEERDRAQPLNVDLDLGVDLSAAGASDKLDDTVDYGSVCDLVVEVIRVSKPLLLERLAAIVAEEALGADSRIDVVTVSIEKLHPPVPHQLATSGVRITRRRSL